MELKSGKTCIINTNNNKKIIILDIDHTLVHAQILNNNNYFKGDFRVGRYIVCKRPYVDNFIKWCFENFSGVIVWSAGDKNYVEGIVKHLFRTPYKPMMVLTRINCKTKYYHKDVAILDDKLKLFSINLNTSNIFFVDDIPHRIKNLTQKNIIPIKPYNTRRHVPRNRFFSGDRDDSLLKIKKMF